jgi:CRP-like cAMP-binding protein
MGAYLSGHDPAPNTVPGKFLAPLEIRRLVQGTLQRTDLSMERILPIMSHRRFRAGEAVIRKGELADRLFYLNRGEVKIVEIGKTVSSGSMLGEIGVFARDQRRTATVVCLTDCEIYELSGSKTKELYYQDPLFAYEVLQIVITRLMENINFPREAAPPAASAP